MNELDFQYSARGQCQLAKNANLNFLSEFIRPSSSWTPVSELTMNTNKGGINSGQGGGSALLGYRHSASWLVRELKKPEGVGGR